MDKSTKIISCKNAIIRGDYFICKFDRKSCPLDNMFTYDCCERREEFFLK